MRLLLPIGIVAFWLVMMGLLIQREFGVERFQPPAADPGATPEPAPPFDSWMAVYATPDSEVPIGYVHSASTPESREGEVGNRLSVAFKLGKAVPGLDVAGLQPVGQRTAPGGVTDLSLVGTAWASATRGLQDFQFDVASYGEQMNVSGALANGVADITVDLGKEQIPIKFPVGKDLVLGGSLGATTLNLPALEVGSEVRVDTFDPTTFTRGTARVRCEDTEMLEVGGERVLTKVITTTLGGVTSTFWVTPREEIVRIQTPVGLTLRKLSEAEVRAAFPDADTTFAPADAPEAP